MVRVRLRGSARLGLAGEGHVNRACRARPCEQGYKYTVMESAAFPAIKRAILEQLYRGNTLA